MVTSIEPSVTSWAETQINALGWQHGPQQNGRELDARVDEGLKKAKTKSGGEGLSKPDHVIILDNGVVRIPVLCEWKGSKGALRDKKAVALRTSDGYMRYGPKGIDRYASLGAAYYASRVVGPGGHERALALAINGYYKAPTDAAPTYEISLYVVANDDTEKVMWVGDYNNLDVLEKKNFPELLQEIEDALDPIAAKLRKLHKVESLDQALKRLNEFLHAQYGIVPSHRVNVIAALMIASLGVTTDDDEVLVKPLVDADLYGGSGNDSDGSIILAKVENYLSQRTPALPADKQKSVLDTLRPTLLDKSLSSKALTGTSALKAAFHIVSHGLLPHYHDDRAIDFAGRLFNEMYAWIDVPDAGLNDVVLTPKRTTDLMVELTQIDSDSYVWDWTLGTGAFLVSSMNVMLADAREKYQGEELRRKENQIKVDQLLGIEKLSSVYVLAVLNMILMGDGSSNIIHGDSHTFDGRYQQRADGSKDFFPATTLVLNPPYSAPGKGLIFVKEAFAKMNERGTGKYGAVIIQDSAGSGKSADYCTDILQFSSLVASIKMPSDLFIGKAGVQTSIYVFKVGSPHKPDSLVKFIDFRNDGYKRSNRKKVKDPSINLRPVDDPDGRYAEVAAIVTGRKRDTNYYPLNELYVEDTINPSAGDDWNFDQHAKIDSVPTLEDFRKSVADYLAWEVDQLLKKSDFPKAESQQIQNELLAIETRYCVEWSEFTLGNLFGKSTRGQRLKSDDRTAGDLPFVTAGEIDAGISAWVGNNIHVFEANTITIDMFGSAKYRGYQYGGDDHVAVVHTEKLSRGAAKYVTAAIHKSSHSRGFDYSRNFYAKDADALKISLPTLSDGAPAWDYMEAVTNVLETERVGTLEAYLADMGLADYTLSDAEKKALSDFSTMTFAEFAVGGDSGLFIKLDAKFVGKGNKFDFAFKEKDSTRTTPLVYAKSGDNGIMYWGAPALWRGYQNVISIIYNGVIAAGLVYAQPYETSTLAESYLIRLREGQATFEQNLFMACSLNKSIYPKYSRELLATWANKVEHDTVCLPQTVAGHPDFEFMDTFIGAVKKIVIKNLVDHLRHHTAGTEQLLAGV